MLKRSRLVIVSVFCMLFLWGCGNVHLSAGMSDDVFMQIEDEKVDMDTAVMLLADEKYSYEQLFDSGVWSQKMGNVTTEEYVKDSVGDTLRYLTYMKIMADEMKVQLDAGEKRRVNEAAVKYYDTLTDQAKAVIDINTVYNFYAELKLAEKVFYIVTDEVDTEVSTDEARIIAVQYIFFSTVNEDSNGQYVDMEDIEKNKKYKLAMSVAEKIDDGEDFATLAREYSDDEQYVLEFGRGNYSEDFEDAAFGLEMGRVSDIIETEYGYYIIKCTNDNVESDYDKQSKEIVLSRMTKMFTVYYSDFTKNMECELNNLFWHSKPMNEIKPGSGKLYDIYSEFMEKEE